MSRIRSSDYELHRDQIMRAAAQLFADQGYEGTSMNHVAAACGVSKPLLYHYFRDKQQLLLETVERHFSLLEHVVREVGGSQLSPESRLREYIRRACLVRQDAALAHRVVTQDMKLPAGEARDRVLRKQEAVLSFLACALEEIHPTINGRVSQLLAQVLFCIPLWGKPEPSLPPSQIADALAGVFFGGVGSLPAPQRTHPLRIPRNHLSP